ncbi:hypothetical protein TRFO_23435 [Tritrichomonas foetus]|uniref:Bromo domain-containing protein n=1 Tax=Tritrichomonas foetus TaxID=1144522 RepID=A0A1J4K9Q0_9EUKA|nr:hypothetical protein TRFO_23435 [Tritrichomonas foetus]|eukprot:OHT08151.1 hypothetical protein TRFO_23435 [Tritrichomonas foetus]
MNQNEIAVCSKIFQTIVNNPLSRLFWSYQSDVVNTNILHPVSLEYISTRLSKQKYARAADFIYDLQLCLTNGKNGATPGTVRYAAAQELLLIFENLISSLQPLAHPNLLPLHFITAEFEEQKALPEYHFPETENKEPQSELFKLKSDPNDLASLLRDIKLLTSPDLTIKLAVLVKKLQPEALVMTDALSFNVGIMTEETRVAVRKYVTDLLRDAASGKIDPFMRPFGTKVEPIRVQERGMYLRPSRIESVPSSGQ